jgi:hypothetical protein
MSFDKAVNCSGFVASTKEDGDWIINRKLVTRNVCRVGGKLIQF